MRRVLNFLGVVALVPILLFGAYLGYNAWDRNRLRSFCDDMRPGVPMGQIKHVAASHGIDNKWINDTDSAADGNRKIVVLASSEMGEMTCDVQLKDGAVARAEVYGP